MAEGLGDAPQVYGGKVQELNGFTIYRVAWEARVKVGIVRMWLRGNIISSFAQRRIEEAMNSLRRGA